MNKLLICMPLLLFVFCAQLSAQKSQTGNQTAAVQPNGQNTNRVEFVTGAFAQQGGTKDWVEMGLAPVTKAKISSVKAEGPTSPVKAEAPPAPVKAEAPPAPVTAEAPPSPTGTVAQPSPTGTAQPSPTGTAQPSPAGTMATSPARTVAPPPPSPAGATNAPKPDGEVRYRFLETGRDEWSIYLYDQTRDVRIALDLWKKEVKYKGPGDDAYRTLYPITMAFTSSN